jgi:hypothetical protein
MASEGGVWGSSESPIASEEAGTGVGHGGAQTLHERHVRTRVAHCGIQSNRWQVIKWSTWDTFLGWLRAVLGNGPRSKIGAHTKLYKFD